MIFFPRWDTKIPPNMRPQNLPLKNMRPRAHFPQFTVFPCEIIYSGEGGKVGWVGITESREIKLGKKYAKLKLCAILI